MSLSKRQFSINTFYFCQKRKLLYFWIIFSTIQRIQRRRKMFCPRAISLFLWYKHENTSPNSSTTVAVSIDFYLYIYSNSTDEPKFHPNFISAYTTLVKWKKKLFFSIWWACLVVSGDSHATLPFPSSQYVRSGQKGRCWTKQKVFVYFVCSHSNRVRFNQIQRIVFN